MEVLPLEDPEEGLNIIPQPPGCLNSNPYVKTSLSHRLFITQLVNSDITGTVIRTFSGAINLFSLTNAEREKIDGFVRESNLSLGCLFVPRTENNALYLIKTVSQICEKEKVELIESIGNSIVYQLNLFQHFINSDYKFHENGIEIDFKNLFIKVIILIWSQKEVKKDHSAKFITGLTSFIKQKSENGKYFPNFRIDIRLSNPDGIKSALTYKPNSEIAPESNQVLFRHFISSLIEIEQNFAKQNSHNTFYALSTEKFRSFNDQECSFQNVASIVKIFNNYFPSKHSKLELVPNLLQAFENLLYMTTDYGKLEHIAKYGAYMGEVRDFCHDFLSKLSKSNGIFLKNFTETHFSTLLHNTAPQPIRFQIDWIFCGDVIVGFEVGYAEDPDKPTTLIAKKIEQALTKIIPQMELIIHTFYTSYLASSIGDDNTRDNDFAKFLETKFKFIIFITNIKLSTFKKTISSFKSALKNEKSAGKSTIRTQVVNPVRNCADNSLNRLLFLAEDQNNGLKLLKIDQNLDVVDSGLKVDELFQQKLDRKFEIVEYASALFTLASLNKVFDSQEENIKTDSKVSFEIEERYWDSFIEWNQKRNKCSSSSIGLQFILSPEQHRILSENKRFVAIVGEPGSGKTSLLLAQRNG